MLSLSAPRLLPTICTRAYSASHSEQNHYQTLGVPRHATKHHIKMQYYKLSKRHHPDVASDPDSKSAFQAVTEAYAILGDDNKRRVYDRSLTPTPSARKVHLETNLRTYDTTPHRGATHAWEHSHRSSQRRPHRRASRQPSAAHTTFEPQGQQPNRRDGWNSAYRVSTTRDGWRPRQSEADRVRSDSSLWRALQVVGIILFVATLGGWRATPT